MALRYYFESFGPMILNLRYMYYLKIPTFYFNTFYSADNIRAENIDFLRPKISKGNFGSILLNFT